MVTKLRFISDGMLGKLSRWLRILGHDVQYYKFASDRNLIEIAASSDRVLLTRDQNLVHQASKHEVKVYFVEGSGIVQVLTNLLVYFDLNPKVDLNFSRCPKCNGSLMVVPKNSILDEIPTLTSIHYNEFWKCKECGQVYWLGSHWEKIINTLNDVKNLIGNR